MTNSILSKTSDIEPAGRRAPPVPPPLPETRQSGPAKIAFAKDRQRKVADQLSKIIIKGGVLSLLTLAIYRFWMKTDQRRLIWRETRVDGDGFEYTGTALELLIGTMIAIVILAVWFGIANLGLSFLQLAAWQNFDVSFLLAPLIFAPLIAFATYRARRYRMLRTKWRGIRFGMDGSALRYTGVWLLWTFLQIITLGLATPHKTMALERYMTPNMLYGDARFRFEPEKGATRRLFAHWMLPWLTGAALAALLAYLFYYNEGFRSGFEEGFEGLDEAAEIAGTSSLVLQIQMMIGLIAIGMMLIYPFYLRYKSREIATVLSSRRLLDARCESRLTWGVTAKPVLASIGYGILLSIPVAICLGFALFLTSALAMIVEGQSFTSIGEDPGQFLKSLPGKIIFFGGFFLYYGGFIIFSMWLGALIYFRRLHTYICRGTVVHDLDSLDEIRQRVGVDQLESEGFADALDIGGI